MTGCPEIATLFRLPCISPYSFGSAEEGFTLQYLRMEWRMERMCVCYQSCLSCCI